MRLGFWKYLHGLTHFSKLKPKDKSTVVLITFLWSILLVLLLFMQYKFDGPSAVELNFSCLFILIIVVCIIFAIKEFISTKYKDYFNKKRLDYEPEPEITEARLDEEEIEELMEEDLSWLDDYTDQI